MPLPKYQDFMLPLLKATADGAVHHLRDLASTVASVLYLSDADLQELLPSGGETAFHNRLHWARFYLVKAELLSTPSRGAVQITPTGLSLLSSHPATLDVATLRTYPSFKTFLDSMRRSSGGAPSVEPNVVAEDGTPGKRLEGAWQTLRDQLGEELLSNIKQAPPRFFEQLVIDLLVGMGYGGSRRDAARAIGALGDEDKLGLDAVYIQAKRWENPVGRPVVQGFVGSLEGHRARKGVFTRTSSFTSEARAHVRQISQRVVLIDGHRLVHLMMEHYVGVAVDDTFEVLRLDTDYFLDTA